MEEAKKTAAKPKRKTQKQKQRAHRIRLAVSVLLVALLVLSIWYAKDAVSFNALIANVVDTLSSSITHSAGPAATPTQSAVQLPDEPYLDVYIFDVGQGDSILLISPTGETMLVDAGEDDYIYRLNGSLKELGVTRIDALVASHPHSDHIGGMRHIIQTYEIGDFYMPDAVSASSAYEGMLAALYDRDVPSHILYAGDSELPCLGSEITVELLSPWRNSGFSDLNDMSLIFRISYGESSILLTGDAGADAEALALKMLDADSFVSDVLKVAHHGSARGTGKELLDAISPEYAVISCGENNDYGHPSSEVLSLLDGTKVYRTDQNGTVRVVLTKSGIYVFPGQP